MNRPSMHVLFVAAEAMPLAKTGGLGDAVSGLANALQRAGVNVTILVPGYPQALASAVRLGRGRPLSLPMPACGLAWLRCGTLPGSEVRVALLDCPRLYAREGGLYADAEGREYPDNARRFAALAHAAVAIARGHTRMPVPDVIHAHDWHAGLVPLLLNQHDLHIPTVLTLHNMAFQGVTSADQAVALGLPRQVTTDAAVMHHGQLNFLKTGIQYAQHLTTVSHSYAEEILTPHFGHGLEEDVQLRQRSLSAIPNGIDVQLWNPATDLLIPSPYTADALTGKRIAKQLLQHRMGLREIADVPIVALGSRMTHQKMADVALEVIAATAAQSRAQFADVQFAILGCGDPQFEARFRALAEAHPGRIATTIGYSEEAAHLLHAGADILLHGSRFEPFGLTPVYAMRYGTIPVVSRVGGLRDTVIDAGQSDVPAAGATGFTFVGDSVQAMQHALTRALQAYAQPQQWQSLQRHGMEADWSWTRSAQAYCALYQRLTPGTAHVALTPALPHILQTPPRAERIPVPSERAAARREPRIPLRLRPLPPVSEAV